MRKAQFEIMGLAIIVILVSMMIFFALAFGFTERDDVTQQFLEDQFSQNLVDATLRTTLDGCRGTVSDYLISIATESPLPAIGNPSSPPSCTTAEALEEIGDAMEQAMTGYTGRDFTLEFRPRTCGLDADECEVLMRRGECEPGRNTGRQGRQTLSLYPLSGTAELVVFVCQ